MNDGTSIQTLRFALRASAGFTLDLLKIYRGDRDLADALILAALIQSSSAPIAGDPGLQRRYGVFAAPAPATMRRAISMNAVAASLGLPFETVRRRVKRLFAVFRFDTALLILIVLVMTAKPTF